MDALLASLRAAGEPTRLRLLALSAHGELSVTEFTQILGQSQPRVSRHLKLLVEAGLLERFREGALVFYRIASLSEPAHFARTLVDLLPEDDSYLNRDLQRLEQIRERRRELAASYFKQNAAEWNNIRKLHVPEADVEETLKKVVGPDPIENYVDIGTGTGRILALFAEQASQCVGIDQSPEMLAVARSFLEQQKLNHVHVRKGDLYNLPFDDASMDLATIHLVLHYCSELGAAIDEAARVLQVGGRLIIVDFAPHQEEQLRTEHNHARLGFSDAEMKSAFEASGLTPGKTQKLAGDPLTVNIWQATKQFESAD